MLNIICTIEQITPIFCVFLSIIVLSINSKDIITIPQIRSKHLHSRYHQSQAEVSNPYFLSIGCIDQLFLPDYLVM